MSKELVISAAPHETRVAILEDGQLCEIYIEREKEFALVGSIYKGRVTRVLPGMQSAFVDIGLDSDAFLYVSDFLENLEEYDHIVSTVEGKVEKMEQQGGEVFASPGPAVSASNSPAPPGSEPEPAAPVILPGETIGRSPRNDRGSVPPEPNAHSVAPYDRRGSREGRGFGRDRDRGRWGRRGGRRRHGRELPPSKYASQRSSEPRGYPPSSPGLPESAVEQVLLPGESLAKYRDRPVVSTETGLLTQASPEPSGTPSQFQRQMERTPAGWLSAPLADSVAHASPTEVPAQLEQPSSPEISDWSGDTRSSSAPVVSERPAGKAHSFPGLQSAAASPQTADESASDSDGQSSPRVSEPDLSEEEITALAEQLAEAKHEEAQAEVVEAQMQSEAGEEEGSVAGALSDDFEIADSTEGPTSPLVESASHLSGEAPPAPETEESRLEEPPRFEARMQSGPRSRFQRPMRRGGRPHRGGGRPLRRHERHGPPRRPQLISEMLKAGQEIIVQIAKEPLGKKGARITSHVALPGRFLVYMPTVDHIGVSRKIAFAEERSRLRRIVADAKVPFPGGFIVRTAAEGASEEDIRSDVEFLGRQWLDIKSRAEQRKAPALMHRDLNLVERILRDYVGSDYTSVWIDSEEEYGKVLDFVNRFQPRLVGRVKLYTKDTPMFEEFGIQQELDKALRPKVWLKSGGYIVINHTEALVAIDVNTGNYVGRGSTRLEDTIVKTNIEAVKEIVRQIRLRDLGGIIVVDFIDMEERRNREKVMVALDEALRSDRAPSKVLSFNEFGLVAITRKRTKQALERVLCQPCPYCTGSGMVKSIPTICYEVQAEARKMAGELESQSLTLRVHPEIAKALKTRESALIEELEHLTHRSVIIQSDPTLHWEQYDIF